MKIQIDTQGKIIKIENSVNLGELIQSLKKLLPGEWGNYTLETQTIINWSNPIVIEKWPNVYPYNPTPWWQQPITISDSTRSITVSSASDVKTYNLDILCQ